MGDNDNEFQDIIKKYCKEYKIDTITLVKRLEDYIVEEIKRRNEEVHKVNYFISGSEISTPVANRGYYGTGDFIEKKILPEMEEAGLLEAYNFIAMLSGGGSYAGRMYRLRPEMQFQE